MVLSLEGACPLAPEGRYQRERLALLARWGVRLVNLTWNYNNPFASAAVEQDQYGLTPLGRALLADMNHHRMLLDVSHLAERSFWEAIEQTRLPPVASHSNAKSLCDHPRNLSTSQIKAIAQRKGVIGVNFCPAFLSSTRQATIDDVIRLYRLFIGSGRGGGGGHWYRLRRDQQDPRGPGRCGNASSVDSAS